MKTVSINNEIFTALEIITTKNGLFMILTEDDAIFCETYTVLNSTQKAVVKRIEAAQELTSKIEDMEAAEELEKYIKGYREELEKIEEQIYNFAPKMTEAQAIEADPAGMYFGYGDQDHKAA